MELLCRRSELIRITWGTGMDFGGRSLDINGQETLASNGRVHEEMIGVLERGG